MDINLSQISSFALAVEKLGVVGLLAVIAVCFVYLYIKQITHTSRELKEISDGIKSLIEKQESQQKIFFDLVLKEFKNKDE